MIDRRIAWLTLPTAALLADWASKAAILKRLHYEGDSLAVIPGIFHFTLGYNSGAIFGSFQGLSPLVRTLLFGVAGVVALIFFGKAFLAEATPRLERIALGLILGGAMGNGLDRLRHGHVVDFIDVIIRGWHYWTFNVADSFIVCGGILFAWSLLKTPGAAPEEA
ncbi:MAG TPA: signal peptidase II [Holophagaceae bacterium]|nr:signal peptidase II [Holophagaceae bacterium]